MRVTLYLDNQLVKEWPYSRPKYPFTEFGYKKMKQHLEAFITEKKVECHNLIEGRKFEFYVTSTRR